MVHTKPNHIFLEDTLHIIKKADKSKTVETLTILVSTKYSQWRFYTHALTSLNLFPLPYWVGGTTY